MDEHCGLWFEMRSDRKWTKKRHRNCYEPQALIHTWLYYPLWDSMSFLPTCRRTWRFFCHLSCYMAFSNDRRPSRGMCSFPVPFQLGHKCHLSTENTDALDRISATRIPEEQVEPQTLCLFDVDECNFPLNLPKAWQGGIVVFIGDLSELTNWEAAGMS